MRQIRIEGNHPAYTPTQLRAATTWVLRQLEIPADVSAKWSVALGTSTRRQYSGQGGGGVAILRFTSRPLPAEQRAADLVHLLAHELWHNEQHRRLGYRWPRTPSGKRRNMEPGARTAESSVVAAFHADEDALLARWGFERGAPLPAPKAAAPVAPATLAAIDAAMTNRRRIGDEITRHIETCANCRERWNGEGCDAFVALGREMSAATAAWREAKRVAAVERSAPARAAGLEKAKAALARKAERRERAVRAKLTEWERKAKAAAAKVREYRAKVRYYDRKDARLAAATRSPAAGARGPVDAPVAAPAPGPIHGALRGAEEVPR